MFDFIYEWFYILIWQGLMNIVQLMWDLIVWLCGGTPSEWFCSNILGVQLEEASGSNLLYNLISSQGIQTLFYAMITIAGFLIVITIIIAMVRTEVTADDSVRSKKKLMMSTAKAALFTLLLPIIFVFSIALVGAMVDVLTSAMSDNGTTLNNLLITIGFGDNIIDPDHVASVSWGDVWNLGSGGFDYWEMYTFSNPIKQFNWLLVLLLSLACIVFLAIAIVPLVERLIVLALLVVASPIVLSMYPLDDGNRFGIWKDLFISKMISALAIILCLQIYIILVTIINGLVVSSFLGSICKIAIMIIGLFVFNKGAHVLANLVGYSTGMAEGHSQMSTMHAFRAMTMGVAKAASGVGKAATLKGGSAVKDAMDKDKSKADGKTDTAKGDGAVKDAATQSGENTPDIAKETQPQKTISEVPAIAQGGGAQNAALPSKEAGQRVADTGGASNTPAAQDNSRKEAINTPSSGMPVANERKGALTEVNYNSRK